MLFNSLEFALFFPLVAALHFLLPHRWRWLLLLAASYWFYMAWKAEYALLLLLSTVVDWVASHRIHRAPNVAAKRRWLWLSVATNLGILGTFKYYNFISANLREVFGWAGTAYVLPELDLLLPMGISFYTFQTMSYTIDVYRGSMAPARHFGRFALFVTFFPQLVAGPIERAPNLLHQFDTLKAFDPHRIIAGLKRMLWGFFKKLVIADRVAPIVDMVYDDPARFDFMPVALATMLFAVQIYCDFSGYSDIAIGAARVLGFDLMENFRLPYLSASIGEFWSRWHISLSTWFRDYLYIPLGGNQRGAARWYFNLLAVFMVSGLWHGANWTFVAWGATHGLWLVGERMAERLRGGRPLPGWTRWPRVALTLAVVLSAWVLFRAASLADARQLLGALFSPGFDATALMELAGDVRPGILLFTLGLTALFVLAEPFVEAVAQGRAHFRHPVLAYLFNGLLLAFILLFGEFGQVAFIYFQF